MLGHAVGRIYMKKFLIWEEYMTRTMKVGDPVTLLGGMKGIVEEAYTNAWLVKWSNGTTWTVLPEELEDA